MSRHRHRPELGQDDLGPRLTADLLDLFAEALRHRAGARLDDVAVLQRLAADLAAALADTTRDAADEQMTVSAAAAVAGVTRAAVLQWHKKFDLGSIDPHSHMILISKRRLHDFLLRRHNDRLPAAMAEFFAR